MTNKRAQIGETISWVVATILLVVVLIIFIYASVALSEVKNIKSGSKENSEDSADWVNSKTEIAYSINADNKNKIAEWIMQEKKNE